MAKQEAIIEGMRVNMLPVFLTSITTVIGFLSLNVAETPPLHDLGNLTAAGVAFAFIYSVTLLPVLISWLPIKVKVTGEENENKDTYLTSFGDWIHRHKTAVIILTVITTLGLFSQVPKIELNDQFVKYFSKDIEFRTHTDWVTKNMAGIYQAHFDLSSKVSQGLTDPKFLKKIDDFANMYRKVPDITHVSSISDTFKRLNKNMHGDDPSY